MSSNAQSGNVVLFAIDVAAGHPALAMGHVPSFLAFCIGIVASRVGGDWLKRRQVNSRTIRLIGVAIALVILSIVARRLSNMIVAASVGFIAAVQITSLSHIGAWSGFLTFSFASRCLLEIRMDEERARGVAPAPGHLNLPGSTLRCVELAVA